MKRLQLLTICLMLSASSFGQNQSFSTISDPITPQPTLPLGEVFRFDSGLVTQLDDFTPPSSPMDPLFSFDDSRWFSLGNLNTGSQTVYGLRFQLPNRGVTFGYQDITDTQPNPRIQWIDDTNDPKNLEFRFADDFTSTNSDLIAEMTSNGQLILPKLNDVLIGPIGGGFQSIPSSRLSVITNTFDVGIYSRARSDGLVQLGKVGIGIWGDSRNNPRNVGIKGTVSNNVNNADERFPGFAYAIQGNAQPNGNTQNNTSYAGFFNGQVVITGNGSDRKLKKDLNVVKNPLSNISQLKSYTFKYKDNKDLNFPQELRHGFIAQEMEKVYPELVKTITYPIYNDKQELQETGTYKSVNYTGLISELAAAVKELNQKVEDLKDSKTTLVYSSQFTEEELAKIQANGYQLEQNIPNPFSGATSIQYSLPENGPQASIMIFDLSGKLVNSYKLKERKGQLRVNQSDLGQSGMYLYSLFAGGKEIMTKRMLVK